MRNRETYHTPLRRVFRILWERYPITEAEIILKYAIKELNDTMGSYGFVSSLFVFVKIKTFPMENKDFPAEKEQINALKTVRDEIAKI